VTRVSSPPGRARRALVILGSLRYAFAVGAASPLRVVFALLDRLAALVRLSPPTGPERQMSVQRTLGALVFLYGVVLSILKAAHGDVISPIALLMMGLALLLYAERGGRAIRDWGFVFLAFAGYALAASAVPDLGLNVHYTPQIEAERLLAFGSLPTNWLQDHLYQGETGFLEVFSILMYMSHFLAPILLASLIWLYWNNRGFHDLFFGILAVSLLGDITFLLAPTAPPWLAADNGLIPEVHHVIKQGLYDLGLDSVAAKKDLASSYNIVAAIPSLHAAWPVIGLLVIRKHRLPLWLFWAQAAVLAGVVFSIVYTGEHYLVDALVGGVYAIAAWWLVQRALCVGREAEPKSAARLPLPPVPTPHVHPQPLRQIAVSHAEDADG
jgi:hypothetical protein